jgi:hypothetical protein
VKILKIYVLKSDILDKTITIGSECLFNFEKDQEVLNNKQVCNDCKQRDISINVNQIYQNILLKYVTFVSSNK